MEHKKGIYERFLKRFFDIILSLIALIVLSPLLLIIAILVRIKLGSPIIFSQERPGKGEKIFKLYKFRSMTNDTDDNGNYLPDEQRLTKFGKFLRVTSIDELPELINILKGDMSIIGPRPLLVKYLPYYTETEHRRHNVRPGLTGWAQVSGRNELNWSDRFKKDIEYINKISFIFDIKIILLTIQKVISREKIQMGNNLKFNDLNIERKNQENHIINIDYYFYKVHKKELLYLINELMQDVQKSKLIINNMGKYLKDKSAQVLCYRNIGDVDGIIWSYYISNERIHINYFIIRKMFQNEGIGHLLMENTIKISHNAKYIELLVNKKNNQAIKFYEKFDFIKEDYDEEKYKMILDISKIQRKKN